MKTTASGRERGQGLCGGSRYGLCARVPSAFHDLYTSFRIFIVSGRPPRALESQSSNRSGSTCRWMSPLMVGPNVFSWSEPVFARSHKVNLCRLMRRSAEKAFPRTDPDQEPAQWGEAVCQRYNYAAPVGRRAHQFGDWMHVERAAPMPVPVQIRIPRLYRVEVFEMPANCDACVSQACCVMVESSQWGSGAP